MITGNITVSHRLAVLGTIALAVIALTGCGSSSSSSTTKTTTATSTPTTTTSTGPSAEADKQVAGRSSLRLSDFPTGWEQKDTGESQPSDCSAVKEAKGTANATTTSPQFSSDNDKVQASSATYVYRSIADAERGFTQLSNEATRTCLAKEVAERATKQNEVTLGEITTGQVRIGGVGDERAASRLTIPVKASGVTIDHHRGLSFCSRQPRYRDPDVP